MRVNLICSVHVNLVGFEFSNIFSAEIFEIRMSQSILYWYSFSGIKSNHLLDEVKSFRTEVLEISTGVSSFETRISRLEVRTFLQSRPGLFIWSTMILENFKDLINFRITHKEGSLFNHFVENTTQTPNIDTKTVCLLTQKNFRSSVPKGFYFVSKSFNGNTKSPCQTKISNFNVTLRIN